MAIYLKLLLVICTGLSFISTLSAQTTFTSDSFKVLAPVMYSGARSTSDSFILLGSISELAIGTSTVDSSSQLFGGFLYFPFVSTPTVSATAGDAQVSLSWTAASASTGWSLGGYAVGQSTTSGGPYTYTDLGNVLSSTRTGLTNGTTYYFVIRVQDALNYYIATSSEVSSTPAAAGGGGGGGGDTGYLDKPSKLAGTLRALSLNMTRDLVKRIFSVLRTS